MFEAAEIKTGQALRSPVAPELGPWLDFYLENVRPGYWIAAACTRLWPGSKGRLLAYDETLYSRIVETTKRLFGVAIAPHSFRSIAATAIG